MSQEYEKVNPIWDSGNFVLMKDIDDKSCMEAINFIQWHNMQESPLEELTIVVNSPGGSVSSAFALIDVMKSSKIPVNTLALGQVASCGLIISMSGKHRSISENCMAMSHQYSWGSSGKHEDLIKARKAQDMTHDLITKHYMKCSGKTKRFVEKNLLPHHDVWLSPEECVEMGLFDEVKSIY